MTPARLFILALCILASPRFSPAALAQEAAPAAPSLVERDRIRLNLAGAETVVDAVKARAESLGLKMNVAVVDDGGNLLAFARMDDARPASVHTALTKAVSAATFRQETGPLPAKGEPDVLLSLGLPAAALASGGKVTNLKGGVPIVVDGQVIGAVGLAGGTGEQDADLAKSGVQALLDLLKRQEAPASPEASPPRGR